MSELPLTFARCSCGAPLGVASQAIETTYRDTRVAAGYVERMSRFWFVACVNTFCDQRPVTLSKWTTVYP